MVCLFRGYSARDRKEVENDETQWQPRSTRFPRSDELFSNNGK